MRSRHVSPHTGLQPVWDGNLGGAASSKVSTNELPAVRANAFVDRGTSATTSESSGSSSSALDLPIFADVAVSGGEAGSKRRRNISKARDPLAGDREPPAAQPDPNEEEDEDAGVDLPGDPEVWKGKRTREKRMFIGRC